MNVDPPKPFDPDEAIALFTDPEIETHGLTERSWFYTVVTCRAIRNFTEPEFTLDKVHGPKFIPMGAVIEFVVKERVFHIDVSPTRAKLWTAPADDGDVLRNRYMVFDGDVNDSAAWEKLLVEVGRVERFGVFLRHADTLRRMWSELLIERKRRDDERGF